MMRHSFMAVVYSGLSCWVDVVRDGVGCCSLVLRSRCRLKNLRVCGFEDACG